MAKLYTPEWLETQTYTHDWGRKALHGVFARFGKPVTMLDLGCGDGYLCREAEACGVASVGVDIALPDLRDDGPPILIRRDLSLTLDLEQPFALVLCWETAEHLPESASGMLLTNVAHHVGDLLVWTAAIPDQDGEGHINCRPPEYWRSRLERLGLTYLREPTEELRAIWKVTTGPCFWYPQNLQVFARVSDD